MGPRKYLFKVSGEGNFPFKCLYHSQAWPFNETSAEQIVYSCATVAKRQEILLSTHRMIRESDIELWKAQNWPIIRVMDSA